MASNNDKELFDIREDKTVRKDVEEVASRQKEQYGQGSVKGRPNIDEISKRNKEEKRQDKQEFYVKTGIIAFVIIVVMFLIYFFS